MPYLSLSQPHLCFSPPSESFFHNLSTSSWDSQCTKNDIPQKRRDLLHMALAPCVLNHQKFSGADHSSLFVPRHTEVCPYSSLHPLPFALSPFFAPRSFPWLSLINA